MLENMCEMQNQAARLQSIKQGSGTRHEVQITKVKNIVSNLFCLCSEKLAISRIC